MLPLDVVRLAAAVDQVANIRVMDELVGRGVDEDVEPVALQMTDERTVWLVRCRCTLSLSKP